MLSNGGPEQGPPACAAALLVPRGPMSRHKLPGSLVRVWLRRQTEAASGGN